MDTFKIYLKNKSEKSASRNVKFDTDVYEKIIELSANSKNSFNSIVNDAVRFALNHLELIDNQLIISNNFHITSKETEKASV